MKYTAFISYNSKDDRWAKWLQRKLESYHIPVIIRNEKAESIRQEQGRLKVFRYRSDLNTVSLNEGLAKELDDARWLIVICSPNSAKSEWVGKEIRHFLDTGRRERIIPFIVDGTSYSGGADECLNPVLKAAFPDGDILGVNIEDYGDDPWFYRKRKALVRTVSLLVEVPDAFSYLWNRYRMRFWEGVALKVVFGIAIVLLLLYAWRYNVSFDYSVQLDDRTPKNTYLPAPDSLKISMQLDDEKKTCVLSKMGERGAFQHIPGKFAGQEVKLHFEAYGYETKDTLIRLGRNGELLLPVCRDDTYGILAGQVSDETGSPIADAVIEAEGIETQSDADGKFEIKIPIGKQKPVPFVRVSKQGFRTEEFRQQPVSREWQVMLIR